MRSLQPDAGAACCVTAVEAHVRELLQGVGRDPSSITPAAIKHFCKNARYIRWV